MLTQANLVPQLLTIMAQLAQRHSPAGVEELMPEHLASLTPSHQAMLAASRLLPQADSFSSSQGLEEGDTLAQMHASPFAAQDTSAGMPIQLIPASAALHATVMPYPDLY